MSDRPWLEIDGERFVLYWRHTYDAEIEVHARCSARNVTSLATGDARTPEGAARLFDDVVAGAREALAMLDGVKGQ